MIGPNRPFSAVVVAAVVLLGAGRAAAEPYHNGQYDFNLELPASWRSLTPKEMKQLNATAKQATGENDAGFLAGFRDTDGDLMSAPYLLVGIEYHLPLCVVK